MGYAQPKFDSSDPFALTFGVDNSPTLDALPSPSFNEGGNFDFYSNPDSSPFTVANKQSPIGDTFWNTLPVKTDGLIPTPPHDNTLPSMFNPPMIDGEAFRRLEPSILAQSPLNQPSDVGERDWLDNATDWAYSGLYSGLGVGAATKISTVTGQAAGNLQDGISNAVNSTVDFGKKVVNGGLNEFHHLVDSGTSVSKTFSWSIALLGIGAVAVSLYFLKTTSGKVR